MGGHQEVIEMFLFQGDIEDHLRDGEGRTPLSYAVEGGYNN
jgi:hypothetical protein